MKISADNQRIPASLWRRFAAGCIDALWPFLIAYCAVLLPVTDYAGPVFGTAALCFALWNSIVRCGRTGASLGRVAMGIAVYDARGNPPGALCMLLRETARFLSLGAFGAGYISVLSDVKKRAWHDRIAQTAVCVGKSSPVSLFAAQCAGLALLFWLYHLWMASILVATNISFGGVGPDTVPLYAELRGSASLWLLPPASLAVLLCMCFRWLQKNAASTLLIIGGAFIFKCLFDTTVALIDSPTAIAAHVALDERFTGWYAALIEPYYRKGLEYYWDVPHVRSAASFLAEYSSIVLTKLSLHSGTHPPGAVLFLYGVSQLFAPDILTAALASIAFTSLSVVPAYLLALELTGKKTAGFALFLYLLAPNAAMFNATCMDGVFSVLPITALYLFCKALLPYWHKASPSPRQLVLYSALAGLALGAGMLLSFVTVFIAAMFSAAVLLTRLADNPPKKMLAAALASAAAICAFLFLLVFHQKNVIALAGTVLCGLGACWVLLAGTWSPRFKAAFAALCIAGVACIVFYFVLYLATDYNLLSSLKVALRKDTHNMGSGSESVGRYLYLTCANFAAFFIAVGLPITVLWLRETCCIATSWLRVLMQPDSACMDAATGRSPEVHLPVAGLYAMAYIATLLTLNFASLFTLEVERIWIFMIPLIAVAAGRQLQELCERAGSLRPALGVGMLLAGQTLLFETYLYTYW